ncbi:MAG TPA: response regulator [Actinomycetota bacterium]|jgi:two-component system phosphate regulon response regulator PhoB
MSRPVVLVAEDDASVRLTLEFVLTDGGFEVVFAHDGEQALALAQSSLPSAILLDQVMPKMDGKEVLSALRKDDATAEIPVFVLTGMDRGSPEDWPGAHFVGKPFSPGDLVTQLKKAIVEP